MPLNYFRKRRLNVIKPFGKYFDPQTVSFSLYGYSSALADSLKKYFETADQVEVIQGNMLDSNCDAIVSPANSFGDMSGGLDKKIDDFYKGAAQERVQQAIRGDYYGELPVGTAIIIEMKTEKFPFLIVAPTMRIPGSLNGTINAFLAMRAILIEPARYNASHSRKIRSLAIPGLCTGVGSMPFEDSAQQMRTAFDSIVGGNWKKVIHPAMAPYSMK